MIENFGDKNGTAGFGKNPQNINRTGANRKSFASVISGLKKKGITALKKEELIEFYTLIFNANEDELKRIASDKKQPMVLRYIITELNSSKTRSKALADLRDYMFGQAQQEIKHEHKLASIPDDELDVMISKMTDKVKL